MFQNRDLGHPASRAKTVNMKNKDHFGASREKREQLRQNALAAWSHYQTTGLHATAEEADAWLAKLETGKNATAPECHV